MICPNTTAEGKRRNIQNAGARIAQSLGAVVGLFTATPVAGSVVDFFRLMVIVKGPTEEERAKGDAYRGFKMGDRIPPCARAIEPCKELEGGADKELRLYRRMQAECAGGTGGLDPRNNEGIISYYNTRPAGTFARACPHYTKLQGRALTQAIVMPCVLEGQDLKDYINARFLQDKKDAAYLLAECRGWEDPRIQEHKPPKEGAKGHFENLEKDRNKPPNYRMIREQGRNPKRHGKHHGFCRRRCSLPEGRGAAMDERLSEALAARTG